MPNTLGLEREIAGLMRELAPDLMEIPGCSAILAADLIGQTAGFSRFSGEAAFAMRVGVAPLPVSSGKSCRHRLNRCGNRKLNSVIHMIAVTQARMHPPAMAYMERKQAEGMSYREALRCLKRLIGSCGPISVPFQRPWRCRVGIGATPVCQQIDCPGSAAGFCATREPDMGR